MSGIDVGAKIDGRDAKSKTELRDTLRDRPAAVEFYSTALVGEHVDKRFTGETLPEDVRLDVTGPNPYTARNWFGNVELTTRKGLRFDGKAIPAAKLATAAEDGTPGVVKLTGITSLATDALRETLTADELAGVTLTASTMTFPGDPAAMLAAVKAAKERAAAAHGANQHPARTLNSVIRKLRDLVPAA